MLNRTTRSFESCRKSLKISNFEKIIFFRSFWGFHTALVMFKKEKTVIFGVSDPKSVRFEHVPKRVKFVGDVKILAIWGGKPRKFWEIGPQITDFPLGNRISGLKIVKIFACGALMIPHQFPQNFRLRRSEKIDFWRLFWSIFDIYFPPILEGYGGEIFISPPFQRGMGGKLKNHFPPILGGKTRPLVARMSTLTRLTISGLDAVATLRMCWML